MNKLRSFLMGTALVALVPTSALAADMFTPAKGSMKDAFPHSVAIQEGASWYLRADVGYVWNDIEDGHLMDQYLDGVSHKFENLDADNAFSIGGGVGYYFSHNFRGDLTVEYRSDFTFRGTVKDSHAAFDRGQDPLTRQGTDPTLPGYVDYCDPVAPNPGCTPTDPTDPAYDPSVQPGTLVIDGNGNQVYVNDGNPATNPGSAYNDDWDADGNTYVAAVPPATEILQGNANNLTQGGIYYEEGTHGAPRKTHISGELDFDIQSTVYMANMYYDFEGRAGFRPFIGAGIGFAHHELSKFNLNGVSVANFEEQDTTEFAWAVMAGANYEVRKGVNFEFGYRYTDLGDVSISELRKRETVDLNPTVAACNYCSGAGGYEIENEGEVKDLTSHEIRVGLRYDIR
ncbi:MAG: outer membrane beta-barrel protein [Pseudomonadota bacterium]